MLRPRKEMNAIRKIFMAYYVSTRRYSESFRKTVADLPYGVAMASKATIYKWIKDADLAPLPKVFDADIYKGERHIYEARIPATRDISRSDVDRFTKMSSDELGAHIRESILRTLINQENGNDLMNSFIENVVKYKDEYDKKVAKKYKQWEKSGDSTSSAPAHPYSSVLSGTVKLGKILECFSKLNKTYIDMLKSINVDGIAQIKGHLEESAREYSKLEMEVTINNGDNKNNENNEDD